MLIRTYPRKCSLSIRISTRTSRTVSTTQGWRSAHLISPVCEMATRSQFRSSSDRRVTEHQRFNSMDLLRKRSKLPASFDNQLGLPYQEYCQPTEMFWKFPPYLMYAPLLYLAFKAWCLVIGNDTVPPIREFRCSVA